MVFAWRQPSVSTLKPSNGKLEVALPLQPVDESRGGPRSTRELANGKLMIAEGLRLQIGDFSSGKSEIPADLPAMGDLTALSGDSSIYEVLHGWQILVGEHAIGFLPTSVTERLVKSLQLETIKGADAFGHLLVVGPPAPSRDSSDVILVDRVSGERRTIAALYRQPIPTRRTACRAFEYARLTTDGWVAILRANPYRVDWRNPDGTWIHGAPISTPRIEMNQKERDAYAAWRTKARIATVNSKVQPPPPSDSITTWPDVVCPWVEGFWPRTTPDGKLVVYRVPTSGSPATRYDVVNRGGVVERQLVMPATESILSFGAHSVYVIVTSDSNQVIRRHPWP